MTLLHAGDDGCMPELYYTSELGADPGACARRQAAGKPRYRYNQCESFQCSGDTKAPGVCVAWAESCPTTP